MSLLTEVGSLHSVWDETSGKAEGREATRRRAAEACQDVLDQHDEELRSIAEIVERAERAEAARELRGKQEHFAAISDRETRKQVQDLRSILVDSAAEPARDVSYFRRSVPSEPAPTIADVSAPPRPSWDEFAPTPPKMFGRRRYDRERLAAQRSLDKALERHDRRVRGDLAKLIEKHENKQKARQEQNIGAWNEIENKIKDRQVEALSNYFGSVLLSSSIYSEYIDGGRATYEREPHELVLELDLPDIDLVPDQAGWKYFITKKKVEPLPLKAKDAADIYADFVAQLSLAVLNDCFRASESSIVRSISLNGHVRTTDPATGRPDHPCLITLSVDRSDFAELELAHPKLDPKVCLRKLGAEISPHPYELEHIRPMVDFDLAKYRIARGPEALAAIDHRMDLLRMNPYDFERLVRDLFAKMGYDTWRTESSRDDGIDAIATRSDPHMPVECIVQAKRFKGAVSPKEIQALMGAMTEKPTATHGYLVTTSWLSPRSRQRARGQRIHTIERNQLASMVKELLGYDVVISSTPPVSSSEKSG